MRHSSTTYRPYGSGSKHEMFTEAEEAWRQGQGWGDGGKGTQAPGQIPERAA